MDKRLDQLVERLQKAYGERLVSVVLYGSAAAGDHHAGFSDFNILCVLSEIDAARTGRRRRAVSAGGANRAARRPCCSPSTKWPLPPIASPSSSTTCKRHHRLLFGKDVIPALVVEDTFYRAQVEHDLRAKLLRLRQKASGMLSDANLLRRLLLDSVSTFCVLFRHALLLHGVAAPPQKREVVRLAGERFGIDPAPFEKLLDVREERLKPREMDPVAAAGRLPAVPSIR